MVTAQHMTHVSYSIIYCMIQHIMLYCTPTVQKHESWLVSFDPIQQSTSVNDRLSVFVLNRAFQPQNLSPAYCIILVKLKIKPAIILLYTDLVQYGQYQPHQVQYSGMTAITEHIRVLYCTAPFIICLSSASYCTQPIQCTMYIVQHFG